MIIKQNSKLRLVLNLILAPLYSGVNRGITSLTQDQVFGHLANVRGFLLKEIKARTDRLENKMWLDGPRLEEYLDLVFAHWSFDLTRNHSPELYVDGMYNLILRLYTNLGDIFSMLKEKPISIMVNYSRYVHEESIMHDDLVNITQEKAWNDRLEELVKRFNWDPKYVTDEDRLLTYNNKPDFFHYYAVDTVLMCRVQIATNRANLALARLVIKKRLCFSINGNKDSLKEDVTNARELISEAIRIMSEYEQKSVRPRINHQAKKEYKDFVKRHKSVSSTYKEMIEKLTRFDQNMETKADFIKAENNYNEQIKIFNEFEDNKNPELHGDTDYADRLTKMLECLVESANTLLACIPKYTQAYQEFLQQYMSQNTLPLDFRKRMSALKTSAESVVEIKGIELRCLNASNKLREAEDPTKMFQALADVLKGLREKTRLASTKYRSLFPERFIDASLKIDKILQQGIMSTLSSEESAKLLKAIEFAAKSDDEKIEYIHTMKPRESMSASKKGKKQAKSIVERDPVLDDWIKEVNDDLHRKPEDNRSITENFAKDVECDSKAETKEPDEEECISEAEEEKTDVFNEESKHRKKAITVINDATVRALVQRLLELDSLVVESDNLEVPHHKYLDKVNDSDPNPFLMSLLYEKHASEEQIQRPKEVMDLLSKGVIIRDPASHMKLILKGMRQKPIVIALTSNLDSQALFNIVGALEGLDTAKDGFIMMISIVILHYLTASEDSIQEHKRVLDRCISLIANDITKGDNFAKQIIEKYFSFIIETEKSKEDSQEYTKMMRCAARLGYILTPQMSSVKANAIIPKTKVTLHFICPKHKEKPNLDPYDFGQLTNYKSMAVLLRLCESGTRSFCLAPEEACKHRGLLEMANVFMSGRQFIWKIVNHFQEYQINQAWILSAVEPVFELLNALKTTTKSSEVIIDIKPSKINADRKKAWQDSGLLKKCPYQHTKMLLFEKEIKGHKKIEDGFVLTLIFGSYQFSAGPVGFDKRNGREGDQWENISVIQEFYSSREELDRALKPFQDFFAKIRQ